VCYGVEIKSIRFAAEAQGFEWDRAPACEHIQNAWARRTACNDVIDCDPLACKFEVIHPCRRRHFAGSRDAKFLRQPFGVSEKDVPFCFLNNTGLSGIET
jgi:hypothetical protein